jgi:hypothetical protein
MEIVNVSVRLHRVTKDDAQNALDAMQDIFDEYEIPDETRLKLWEHYQTFASDVLIRLGEFSPDVGYSEHNGQE